MKAWSASVVIGLLMIAGAGCGLRFGWTPDDEKKCAGEACGDITLTPENPGWTISNHGSRVVIVTIRWMAVGCLNPSEITLGPSQSQTRGNGGICHDDNNNTYSARYASQGTPAPTPTPSPAKLVKFTITPSTITAGATATFAVELVNAAPPGGAVVRFDSITNTGLTATVDPFPVSLTVPQGSKTASMVVNTHRVTPQTTDILFTAVTSISKYSAQLIIN